MRIALPHPQATLSLNSIYAALRPASQDFFDSRLFPRTVSRTSTSPSSPARPHSTDVLASAHIGFDRPYPSTAALPNDLYEASEAVDDNAISQALLDLVRVRRYKDAARLRAQTGLNPRAYPGSWVFESMALRMLDRTQNSFGKARMNSFLIWWAMTPDAPKPTSLPSSRSPEPNSSEHYIRKMLNVVHKLQSLQPSECPTDGLIRFGILAAQKGYAWALDRTLIPYIMMWSPPTVSNHFLLKYCRAASETWLKYRLPFALRYGRRQRAWRYELAIRTQILAGRYQEAALLYGEHAHQAGVMFEPSFHSWMLKELSALPLTPVLDNAMQRCRANLKAKKWMIVEPDIQEETTAPKTERQDVFDIFVRPHPVNALRLLRSTSSHRPLPEYLAYLMHRYDESGRLPRGIYLLFQRWKRRRLPSQASFLNDTYSRELGYWATAEMIYHLRYRNEPLAAFRILKNTFSTQNIIPRRLFAAMEKLSLAEQEEEGRDFLEGEDLVGFRDENLEATTGVPKPFPPGYALPITWQIFLAQRSALKMKLEDIYRIFLDHIRQPLLSVDNGSHHHNNISMRQLRQLHTKNPRSRDRFNIYVPSTPLLYQATAHHFNAFLWGCTQRRKMQTNEGASSAQAQRIFDDMVKMGIKPTLYSWHRLATAYAYAGNWAGVVKVLRRMESAGFMGAIPSKDEPSTAELERSLQDYGELPQNTTNRVVLVSVIRGLLYRKMRAEAELLANWTKGGMHLL